jgi:thiosulfate/3-mercaptopyruvate sulfurtransferase
MLHVVALLAATAADPIVSTEWLQNHLQDPTVRVVYVGDCGGYGRGHIPGARCMDHMATVGDGHQVLPPAALSDALKKVGITDGAHVVLYGDSPMATGWVFMAIASIGHGDDVSMLDGGIRLWQAEHRSVSTNTPPAGEGTLTVGPAPDSIVDARWVHAHLGNPGTKILDVRTPAEWQSGHLPGATLIMWQKLFADVDGQRFKSRDEIRALLAQAGVGAGEEAVTYCAIGMRASLMFWAARAVGIPARVYVGSYEDWRRDPKNPIVR